MENYSTADLERPLVEQAYARWVLVYDAVCGPFFERGRHSAAAAARRIGGRILEIGVGTGLSFDDYGAGNRIVGIDISEPMIEKARKRLASGRYPHVEDIRVMDAQELAFEDASFDCVVAQFVITLVSDPERVLSECARVVKPGGEIILVNHFYSERGMTAAIERWFARPTRSLGLRPDFPFSRLANWARDHGGVALVERRVIKPYGFFTLVRFRRLQEAAASRAA
ncbi:MAG TPA: class I SAM-dependent methyltransferase [Xanthobacteraceae bacterium]|nr:class I SAM-dependent methyltransferase [Xanthobacteraceae bacterium]